MLSRALLGPAPCTYSHITCTRVPFCSQNRRDEQMMKRRNMAVEPESPLSESNKQVSGWGWEWVGLGHNFAGDNASDSGYVFSI